MSQCRINGFEVGKPAPVRIMGVINCSPESFFQGSRVQTCDIVASARKMVGDGADIIDIGGRSTSPSATPVGPAVEAERMELALGELEGSGITLSVDTTRPEVLERCLRYDIHAVNDIGGLADREYAKIVADSGLPVFLMASVAAPGDPTDMQMTMRALKTVISRCRSFGIEEYVLDPAIGLWGPGRTVEFDWELCRNFWKFTRFGRPLLAAVSRKTFIGKLLNQEDPADRLTGSIAVTMLLLQAGADIIRCHDVQETKEAVRVFEEMERKGREE
ncbi:MAG TPA: dihydropteroate synthase [Methanoregulaceae archaeon]|nr:dihydropteroate synthase [Methanoregulaceae archaeon]